MSLTAFTGTVTAAQLRSNFDDATTQLTTNTTAGQKDWTWFLRLSSLSSATTIGRRSLVITPRDDAEVRIFFVRVTDTVAGHIITGTLTQDAGDAEFLVNNTVSIAVTTINGTVDSRDSSLTDYRTTTGTRFRLKKDVAYRLTLASDSAAASGVTQIALQLRSIRRAA